MKGKVRREGSDVAKLCECKFTRSVNLSPPPRGEGSAQLRETKRAAELFVQRAVESSFWRRTCKKAA